MSKSIFAQDVANRKYIPQGVKLVLVEPELGSANEKRAKIHILLNSG
jgi:hypothetical protein